MTPPLGLRTGLWTGAGVHVKCVQLFVLYSLVSCVHQHNIARCVFFIYFFCSDKTAQTASKNE